MVELLIDTISKMCRGVAELIFRAVEELECTVWSPEYRIQMSESIENQIQEIIFRPPAWRLSSALFLLLVLRVDPPVWRRASAPFPLLLLLLRHPSVK